MAQNTSKHKNKPLRNSLKNVLLFSISSSMIFNLEMVSFQKKDFFFCLLYTSTIFPTSHIRLHSYNTLQKKLRTFWLVCTTNISTFLSTNKKNNTKTKISFWDLDVTSLLLEIHGITCGIKGKISKRPRKLRHILSKINSIAIEL